MVDYTDWDQYIASMNKGTAAGVIQGCWIMSSIQAAEDQSGKWAIVNMPALDDIEGATNYANCGGASWAVSSNCKNTELAFDFLKSLMYTMRILISTADRLYIRISLNLQDRFRELIMAHIILISEVH